MSGLADLGQGEPHLEARPLDRRVQHGDRTAVADGDGLDQRQPEARTARGARPALRRGGRSARTPARGPSAGMPGPSSSTRSTASPASSPRVTVTTDVAWRAALSSRLRTSRCSWTASPSTRAADTPSARTAWPRDRCRATSASTTSSRSTTPRTRGASAPARLVDLGQRQQVGHQLVEALALVQHRRRHVGPVGALGVELGHLDARPDRRQRAPQLVGGVRHELALRRLGRLEPVEHVVHRVGEAGHLVARGGLVDAPVQRRVRDLLDLLAHALDGVQGPSDQPPRDQAHQDHQDRDAEPEVRRQGLDARAHLVEGRRGDDPVGASRRVHDPLDDLVAVRQEARHGHQLTLRVEGEELGGGRARRRLDDVAAGVDHLHPGPTDRRHADHADLLAPLERAHGGVECPGRVLARLVGQLALDEGHQGPRAEGQRDPDEGRGDERDPQPHRPPRPGPHRAARSLRHRAPPGSRPT